MMLYGISILCALGCFASNSAGSLGALPEPQPRFSVPGNGRRLGTQVPFEPIYIPVAETPVSQSIESAISPLLSRNGGGGNRVQNMLQIQNAPNVPFPGGSTGTSPRTQPRGAAQPSRVPVINFNDFMALIRRSALRQRGPSAPGQDVTYVNLGSLIPNAPEVAIPSITLPESLRGSSGTVVSHATRVISGAQAPLGPVQVPSLRQGRSSSLLSSALANINRIPQVPLHPIAAIHRALSGGRISHMGSVQHTSVTSPGSGLIHSGLNPIHHAVNALRQAAANNGHRIANAIHQSLPNPGRVSGLIHPSLLRSLPNTASIPNVPFHPASVLNTAAFRGIGSIPRVPISSGLHRNNNNNINRGVSSSSFASGFVHHQRGFVPSGSFNIASGSLNVGSTFPRNNPLMSRASTAPFPLRSSIHSNMRPRMSSPLSSRRTDLPTPLTSTFRPRSNFPFTVNRVNIRVNRNNMIPQTVNFAQRSVPRAPSGLDNFVRSTSFDDFLHRPSSTSDTLASIRGTRRIGDFDPRSTSRSNDVFPSSSSRRSPVRFDDFVSRPRSRDLPVGRSPVDQSSSPSIPNNFPSRATFDDVRPRFSHRRRFSNQDFRDPRDGFSNATPRSGHFENRRRETFPLDNRGESIRREDRRSREFNLPSPLDERIQENFIRDNFAFPRQFDPISRNLDPVQRDQRRGIVRPRAIIVPPPPPPRVDTRDQRNEAFFPFHDDSTRRLSDTQPTVRSSISIPTGNIRPIGIAVPAPSTLSQSRFPFIPSRALQPPSRNQPIFQNLIQRPIRPIENPINDFSRPIGIAIPRNRQRVRPTGFRSNTGTFRRRFPLDDPNSNIEQNRFDARENRFDARENRFDPRENRFDPRENRFDPRENRFDPRENRFGPEDRLDRTDGDFGEQRFSPNRRFSDPRDDRFDDPRNNRLSPADRFDDQRDDSLNDRFNEMNRRSFTPFSQPRFPTSRRPDSQFSITPVSRELTRFLHRSPRRRPKGSFLISFLLNIDDVSNTVDDAGFDVNRGAPPGFQNRFIPRTPSSPFTVRGPMGEDINRLEETDIFENQRRGDVDDFDERFMRSPRRSFNERRRNDLNGLEGRPRIPFSGRDFPSRASLTPPMALSPASRVSMPQMDPPIDRRPMPRADQLMDIRPLTRPQLIRPITPSPRPFGVAIPDPNLPRNQPFLSAAIEGQFDGPASDIDFNAAFNQRRPSLTSEPVIPGSMGRLNLPVGSRATSRSVAPDNRRLAPSNIPVLGNTAGLHRRPHFTPRQLTHAVPRFPDAPNPSSLNIRQAPRFDRNLPRNVPGVPNTVLQGPRNLHQRGFFFGDNENAVRRVDPSVYNPRHLYVSKMAYGKYQ
ncbi:uncharacterized protein LOC125683852 [Ostrea edulis]|uniref:uncharacterized protein LOC125683852 n=1 Tax=Ostrea edulis TaxID=37623 RepID=UPI0024AE99F5|nr:uncharacterized protein LOC125683852 [Ostrea edulis]